MTDEERLQKQDRSTLQTIVDSVIVDADDDDIVSPSSIATKAMDTIDPNKTIHANFPLAYLAAHLEFRQIARSILREKFDPSQPSDEETEQLRFPGPGFELLQRRYPKCDGEGYGLLDTLNEADIEFNARRLERAGQTFTKHAEQLRRWGKAKFQNATAVQGVLA